MSDSLDISSAVKVSIPAGCPIGIGAAVADARPRHTWLPTPADLQPQNLGLASAWRFALDRSRWRHLIVTCDSFHVNKDLGLKAKTKGYQGQIFHQSYCITFLGPYC